MKSAAVSAHRLSMKVNWFVERFCVFLMVMLVLDVWLGIVVRYVVPWVQAIIPSLHLQLTFTEELARYLMIWMALLAVSSGIAHREHIGVLLIFEKFPAPVRRWLAVLFDVIALVFFGYLLVYGIQFTHEGFKRFTMIYSMPKGYPYMGVPLAAFFACVQLVLVGVRDYLVFGQPGVEWLEA